MAMLKEGYKQAHAVKSHQVAECLQAAVNFALYSSGASGVKVCLFTEADLQIGRVSYSVDLDSIYNKTGDVWHIALPQMDATLLYGQAVPQQAFS